jgi:hypothetical protein
MEYKHTSYSEWKEEVQSIHPLDSDSGDEVSSSAVYDTE